MKKGIFYSLLVGLLLTVSTNALAHEKISLTGYVVDVACFAGHTKDAPAVATKTAAQHTKNCALMPDCVKRGYGVYANGKWYPFDAKGNALAKTLFGKTTRKDHSKVTVEGLNHEGQILVEKITEAK